MSSRPDRSAAARFAALVGLALGLVVLLFPARAEAYVWMIRHGSTQCAACHADPSGAGLLTPYGRARSETVLRTRFGAPPSPKLGKLLYGLDAPDGLLLGGSFRNGYLLQHVVGAPQQAGGRFLQMQADLRGQLTVDRLRVALSLGFLHEGGRATRITTADQDNLVSREHWLGLELGEERTVLVRAGRLALPFGLRGNEHTMWVRSTLRTDINEGQQLGAAFAWSEGSERTEVMLVAGNLQVRPDVYREQGLVGYYEHAFGKHAAVGVSALALHASSDVQRAVPTTRQAYGVFARVSPRRALVFLAELDALVQSARGVDTGTGWVGLFSTDLEPTTGLHVTLSAEGRKLPLGTGTALGEWVSLTWFFAPHADARIDGIFQLLPGQGGGPTVRSASLLAQLHFYL